MITLAGVLALFDDLAKLGITPPMQTALTAFFADLLGVPAPVLDAAIQASQDIKPPKQ